VANHPRQQAACGITKPVTPQKTIAQQQPERRGVPYPLNPRCLVQLQGFNTNACQKGIQHHVPYRRLYKKYSQEEKPAGGIQRITAILGNNIWHACPILARAKADGDDGDEAEDVDEAFFEGWHNRTGIF